MSTIATSPNNGQRVASPQAWRRLWKHVTPSELGDITNDIAHYVEWRTSQNLSSAQVDAIHEALASYPWDLKTQAR